MFTYITARNKIILWKRPSLRIDHEKSRVSLVYNYGMHNSRMILHLRAIYEQRLFLFAALDSLS